MKAFPHLYTSDHNHDLIIYTLMVEHILSYCAGIYRNYEIGKRGVPDINGVYRAKNETILRTVEIIFDGILFGFVIKHMLEMDYESMHRQAYYTYWILIDCIIMFLTQGYNYMSQFMRSKQEIIKNIYTLHFLQEKKLEAKAAYDRRKE